MSSTSTISYASNNVITHNAGIITSAIPNQSNYNSASENSLAPVAYSFSLSLFLLLIVSYQKYHMDKVNNSNDYCYSFSIGNLSDTDCVIKNYTIIRHSSVRIILIVVLG